MREKRLPQAYEEAGDEEEEPTKRPRTRFVELQPTANDPADAIDEEVPGAARLAVEPLVLADSPFNPYKAGDPALTASHAAADPGFARVQRALLRRRQQEQGALGEALKAQEPGDQPEEAVNEGGTPLEPFHLKKELEEGFFDKEGNYLAYEGGQEGDAWLDSIEDRVAGTGPDRGRALPDANEPVAEPPRLASAQLAPYRARLVELLQSRETVPAALRRLAGAGPVLDKFYSKEEARRFFQERVRSGHAVPPGNHEEFTELTEAAEVLFDHGQTDVYSSTREQLEAAAAAVHAPPAAASPHGGPPVGSGVGEEPAAATRGRRHHRAPPSAAPATASEPSAAPDKPSVPSGERTAATTRGGEGPEAAAHGFAAELVKLDMPAELPLTTPPPSEVEMGLGMPAAAPTALELQRAAFSAPGQDVTAGAAPTAVGAPAERPPGLPAGADLEQAEEGQLLDEALEAAFWEALPRQPGGETAGASGGAGADAGAAPAVREKPSAGAGGASGEPAEAAVAASAAGNVSLLAGLVQPAVGRTGRQGEAGACLGGRLPSVERVLAEQEVQAMHAKPADAAKQAPQAVAFDNETANLVTPGASGRDAPAEE
ncbi:CD2-binding family [Micractinium conductrix]|uniref:CD2-binding family n=1 Tax=Micractinium conductrix TaxID=554055 RepID=A0A2P6VM44_9CHLO|nr:CD2-binding family [Micractinium conductrix]|eukprot:PSC75164.1 CD2-binding family [Micractinium conductrix]